MKEYYKKSINPAVKKQFMSKKKLNRKKLTNNNHFNMKNSGFADFKTIR